MRKEKQNKIMDNKNEKNIKLGYGHYLLIAGVLNYLFNNIFNGSFDALQSSIIKTLFDFGVSYFFVFWIMDLIRKRGGKIRSWNKILYWTVNSLFVISVVLVIINLLKNN
jgi:thiosulfate reductase cytochrome b subunit